MRLLIFLFAGLVAFAPAFGQTREYAVGQVWAYQTAPGDEASLIKIQEVDTVGPKDQMEVFHISMIGLEVPWQDGPLVIQHLPVSRETLDASVTVQVESTAVFPDYREGRAVWEEANGGVFTITLAEIADFLRDQFRPPTEATKQKGG